jgi:tetratricopeptide (TPR) repeat protein
MVFSRIQVIFLHVLIPSGIMYNFPIPMKKSDLEIVFPMLSEKNIVLAGLFFFLSLLVWPGSVTFGDENKTAERYKGLSKEALDVMTEVDQRNSNLVDMFAKLRDAYELLHELKKTFGVDARRNAERQIKSMEKKLPRAHEDFKEELTEAMEPYLQRREELKERLFKMESNMDVSDMKKFLKQQEQTRKVREETAKMEQAISALNEMLKVLSSLEKDLPDTAELLGTRGSSEARRVKSEEYEDVVEAYYEVRDYEADIERLKTKKKNDGENWTPRDDAMIERLTKLLQDAMTEFLKEVDSLEKPMLDEKQDVLEDIEKIENRLGRAGDRRKEKYNWELIELTQQLESLEKKLAMFERLRNLVAPKDEKKK